MLETMKIERLKSLLEGCRQLKIGLIGDLFLDRYLALAPGVKEMSIETGLEAYQIDQVRNSPGALGTVMNNLAALGVGRLVPVTVLGNDGHGYDLLKALREMQVELDHVVMDDNRLTPTYTKPMRQDEAGIWHELNRLDVRSRQELSAETVQRLIQYIESVFRSTDGVIVLDQINEPNWGVVNDQVRNAIYDISRRHLGKLVFIDSRRFLGQFRFGVLKGNRSEILAAAEVSDGSEAKLKSAITSLTAKTGRSVFCTVGERGTYVAGPDVKVQLVPGYSVPGPVDIVGAGDAATSGIVTALLCGASVQEAATLGNLAASITVQQLGTTGTASPEQILARWTEMNGKART